MPHCRSRMRLLSNLYVPLSPNNAHRGCSQMLCALARRARRRSMFYKLCSELLWEGFFLWPFIFSRRASFVSSLSASAASRAFDFCFDLSCPTSCGTTFVYAFDESPCLSFPIHQSSSLSIFSLHIRLIILHKPIKIIVIRSRSC
jgi:hypothetical protein